jgi:hypothetical protein
LTGTFQGDIVTLANGEFEYRVSAGIYSRNCPSEALRLFYASLQHLSRCQLRTARHRPAYVTDATPTRGSDLMTTPLALLPMVEGPLSNPEIWFLQIS